MNTLGLKTVEVLPEDHLERLFGRDLRRSGWTVDVPAPVNDDALLNVVDSGILVSFTKRRKR